MKEYKTFNQQLTILRNRGLIVPTDGKPKRFLEQENYYNVINGYKDLFLLKDTHGKPVEPETYLSNAHFNELKTLFLKRLFHMNFQENIQKLIHIWILRIIEKTIRKAY